MDVQRVKRLMAGPCGGPLRGVYRAGAAGMLAVARQKDLQHYGRATEGERTEAARRVTVALKTFERPRLAKRCVDSLREGFDGRIVVADDSLQPVTDLGPGVDVLPLPFNSGVSVGRNAALDAVRTEFVLVTDDDIVFTAASDIVAMMNYLDDHDEVDLVAFHLVDLPRGAVAREQGGEALFRGARKPRIPFGQDIEGQPVVAKVAQVYLARTDAIRRVRWDERLRMVDHRDFFSRASGEIVCVQASLVRAYHVRAPFDAEYNRYRLDISADMATLGTIWG